LEGADVARGGNSIFVVRVDADVGRRAVADADNAPALILAEVATFGGRDAAALVPDDRLAVVGSST
jgi:hypothetical protein